MLVAMLAWGIFYFFLGEKIEVNKGLGWDGKMYAAIASDFENFISKGTLDSYYYKRTLPSALIFYSHKLLGIDCSVRSIIEMFYALNLLLVLGAMFIWHRVLEHFSISFWNRLVAFFGLFGTYAMVKVNFYYPVLTDTSALFIALWMLLAYLKKNGWSLFLATVLGFFTFPTLALTGALLLIFQQKTDNPIIEMSKWTKVIPWLFSIGFLLFFFLGWLVQREQERPTPEWFTWPSLLCTSAFIFVVISSFNISGLLAGIKALEKVWLLRILAFYVVSSGVVFWFSSSGGLGFTEFLFAFMQRSAFHPFGFLQAHVTYYGPIIILIFLFWNKFKSELENNSTGFKLLIILNTLFAINPVSRHLIAALPFFVIVLIVAKENVKFDKWFYILFSLFALLFSRFWFTINTGPFTGNYLDYPDQRYFMADGQYTSIVSYLIQMSAAVIVAFVLWFVTKKTRVVNIDRTST